MAEERVLGLLVLVPVIGHDGVALDTEVADLPRRHRPPLVVDQDGLVARHGQPGRAGPDLARAVRQEDVQDLGGPDAVQHLHAEAVPPPPVQLLGQRLPCGDAQAERREIVALRRLLHLEHGGVERGHAEEERGLAAVDQLEHRLRERPVGIEDALRPHAHGEVHVAAEAIGEEELGRRDGAVVLRHAEHLQAIGIRAVHHVMLQVHRALGPAGGAGGIEPERRVVPRRLHRVELRGRLADPRVEADLLARGLPGHHDVPEVPRLRERGPGLDQERLGDDGDGGAAVVEEVEIVLAPHHGVDGNGDGADLDRAPEGGEELGRVEQQAEDALLALDAQLQEGVARPVHQLLEAGVGERAVLVVEGDPIAAPFLDMPVDEEARRVELRGNLGDGERHVRCPLSTLPGRLTLAGRLCRHAPLGLGAGRRGTHRCRPRRFHRHGLDLDAQLRLDEPRDHDKGIRRIHAVGVVAREDLTACLHEAVDVGGVDEEGLEANDVAHAGARGSQHPLDVGIRLLGLGHHVAGTDEAPRAVHGDLARHDDDLAGRRHHGVGVHAQHRAQLFARHGLGRHRHLHSALQQVHGFRHGSRPRALRKSLAP